MATVLKISPVTRIEGHLDVQVTLDAVGGQLQVVDSECAGPMFRGFEKLLINRNPRDATLLTQRICGVCPVSHAMASSLALEQAFGVSPPDNGRIVRNLVLAANFIQSHILHFYHLSMPDFVDTTGTALQMSPWKPQHTLSDMIAGAEAGTWVAHYVQALAIRRKAHQMGAVFGGKMPHPHNMVPGGSSEAVTAEAIASYRAVLTEIRAFITGTYLPDAQAIYDRFSAWRQIGRGYGNLLAFGVFDLDSARTTQYLPAGRYTNGQLSNVDPNVIKEYVGSSYYTAASGNVNPASGVTELQIGKSGAYSFIKAPRYQDIAHEAGPLARMWISGDYRSGISTADRILARALETRKIADAADGWLDQLVVDGPVYNHAAIPAAASGIGLTEAPRGALGHWITIGSSKITRYQVVTPTAWNASPHDDAGQLGAIEMALLGTPVSSQDQPVEILRVIHSFDPCLACSVHMVRPGGSAQRVTVHA